jgi:putative aminopeptidase FrvX
VDAAARRGIALQHSVTAYTLAEADELMESAGGVPAAALGIPVRGGRVYRTSDVTDAAAVLAELGGKRWM